MAMKHGYDKSWMLEELAEAGFVDCTPAEADWLWETFYRRRRADFTVRLIDTEEVRRAIADLIWWRQ